MALEFQGGHRLTPKWLVYLQPGVGVWGRDVLGVYDWTDRGRLQAHAPEFLGFKKEAKTVSTEKERLEEDRLQGATWKKWGPYLSERQWGTVREDYSEDGNAWDYFTHDQARSRAYRWGEDGLAGISDDKQRLCFALALWNGKDPILKERLFGLTNSEGNHGEDVKEYYFYLDSTPTHSYMKYLYKYPQAAYPYADLVETNRGRSRDEMEYELLDTGVFDQDRYFDVFVEYAKDGPEDILVQITAFNRGPEKAELHLLPTLWFRNDWASWIIGPGEKPILKQIKGPAGTSAMVAEHSILGTYHLVLRRRRAAAFYRERNEQRAALSRIPERQPLCQRRHQQLCGTGSEDGREPGPPGHQGLGALPADGGSRPVDDGAPASHRPSLSGARQEQEGSGLPSGRHLPRPLPLA